MKVPYTVILVFGLVVVLIFLNNTREVANDDIESSINRALIFLNQSYSKEYLFDDIYIKCVDQLPGCDTNFRRLDSSIVMVFFMPERLKNNPLMKGIISHANTILSNHLKEWENEPLEEKPLDLYSAFPSYYKTLTNMLNEIIKNEDSDGDWEDYSMYGQGFEFRKITDEAWAIATLARNKVDWKFIKIALDKKKFEGEMIMNKIWNWDKTFQYYAMAHILKSFVETKEQGYDVNEYEDFIERVKEWMARMVEDDYLKKWIAIKSEALYWLQRSNYTDKKFLDELAKEILRKQELDGSWRLLDLGILEKFTNNFYYEDAKTHVTLLTVIALENYKEQIK